VNWIPSARLVYNFSRSNSLTITVDGSAREPGFFQLQPIADSSNLNNIVVGNPSLANEFTNNFSVRYNKFDSKAGSSFFVNLSYDRTSDRIVSSRFNNLTGTGRTTTYQNTDGFYGYNGNASYTKPFSNRKYTAGISMFANYDNNISFTDGFKNNGSNWNLRPGANFRVDIDNKMDVTLRADYTAYQTTTRYARYTTTNKAQTLNAGVNGKNYFGDLTFGYDFSKVINYGFTGSVASNPAILNVYTEYRFLKGKMMTVRLQGFDLLNENTGILRTVSETTITDSRTNRLARYFLLSVNMRLAKFAGARGGGRGGGQGGQNNFRRQGQ
jgi:outer membrane receptor protein involved in Fe transport